MSSTAEEIAALGSKKSLKKPTVIKSKRESKKETQSLQSSISPAGVVTLVHMAYKHGGSDNTVGLIESKISKVQFEILVHVQSCHDFGKDSCPIDSLNCIPNFQKSDVYHLIYSGFLYESYDTKLGAAKLVGVYRDISRAIHDVMKLRLEGNMPVNETGQRDLGSTK